MEYIIPVVIIIAAILFLVLFFTFVPLGLWISARASGVHIGIFQLVGMRIRKVIPSRIVSPLIKATKPALRYRSTSWRRTIWRAATWIA